MDGLRIVAQLIKLLDEAEEADVSIYGDADGDEFQVSWWDRRESYSTHHCFVLRETPEGWSGVPVWESK